MKKPGQAFITFLFVFVFISSFLFLSPNQADASTPVRDSVMSSLQQATVISTHGNVSFPGRTEEAFQVGCTYCHSPHGGTGNLATINTYVTVNLSPFTLAGPVTFTARTGSNSYDDGVSVESSRICVTCHINDNRPGSITAMSHSGGLNHLSGDYTGQDCITCHPHDGDGDPATPDGFMPVGGSCVECHKQAQGSRRQIVDSNGDGTGTGGDFKRSSHHLAGATIPTDDDCKVCHEQSRHMQGKVRLYNADDLATVYTDAANPAEYESFCISCHDGDGARRLATPLQPFSSAGSPPAVDPTTWNAAAHNTSGSVGSCVNCHDNGHGSNKLKLLAPWNTTSDGDADDPMKEQERFCYECHAGSPATVDIQAQFALTSHHRITSTEQTSGIQLECLSCHNPHTNNSTNKVSNPEDLTQLADNNNMFCLACHDNPAISPLPAGVSFGTYTIRGFKSGNAATVWDKSAYLNSTHYIGDADLPNIQCRHCHAGHGSAASGYPDLLKAAYTRNMGRSYYPWYGGTGFALCFSCHLGDDGRGGLRDVRNDAFGGLHSTHDDDGPCISCHDVHAPFDTGEFGLVNFEYDRLYGDLTYLAGYNASTAFDRTRNPPCGIACHVLNHSTRSYAPPPNYDTTPGSVFPFRFTGMAGTIYIAETAQGTLVGTINNPDTALQDGFFNGNGLDTYITFTDNPSDLLATNNFVIESRLKPAGLPAAKASTPAQADNEKVIFDRGQDANFRISLLAETSPGVSSFAFWVNPVNKHRGQDWKMALTNPGLCPIRLDHWYGIRISWTSSKSGYPVKIFVDDQGTAGENSDELWSGLVNCTESRPGKVPLDLRIWPNDQIHTSPGDFTIGARAGTYGNVFEGLIESITFYMGE